MEYELIFEYEEEKVEDGMVWIKFQGCWYPIYEDEPDYDEKVENGMIMIFVDGEWHTLMEDPNNFPVLSDDEMNALYDDLTYENNLDYI